jgi:hypothetical protein
MIGGQQRLPLPQHSSLGEDQACRLLRAHAQERTPAETSALEDDGGLPQSTWKKQGAPACALDIGILFG